MQPLLRVGHEKLLSDGRESLGERKINFDVRLFYVKDLIGKRISTLMGSVLMGISNGQCFPRSFYVVS